VGGRAELVSLWQIYRFGYSVALRSASRGRAKDALRLVLEPCNYWRNVEVPAVLNHLSVQNGEKVLDIGSPKLPSLFIWSRLGAEVWSTDLFPYFFEEYSHYHRCLEGRAKGSNFHIEAQDARKLTYPDSLFDKVYAISVLEHIEDDGDSIAMKEISRVLKPGGVCCLTVPFAGHYSEETISQEIYYKKPMGGMPVFYQRHYDQEALHARLIGPSGLQLEAVEYYGERWVPYERIYDGLPRFVKIPISFAGPLASKLFLHRMKSGSEGEPRAALLKLRSRL